MPFTRLRFFDGQILSAGDFETEQAYHLEKRRLHNRFVHGPGVVTGLEISVDGPSITVSPGFALDPFGNEILVEQPVRLSAAGHSGKGCYVTIRYTETLADPVPTSDGSEFTRVIESFAVELSESPAQDALVLGHLDATSGTGT